MSRPWSQSRHSDRSDAPPSKHSQTPGVANDSMLFIDVHPWPAEFAPHTVSSQRQIMSRTGHSPYSHERECITGNSSLVAATTKVWS